MTTDTPLDLSPEAREALAAAECEYAQSYPPVGLVEFAFTAGMTFRDAECAALRTECDELRKQFSAGLSWSGYNVRGDEASIRTVRGLVEHDAAWRPECIALREQVARLESKLNSPELVNFADAVVREAAHQRERWGSEHDAGKAPEDWFWLLGYLAGKALHAAKAGDTDKTLHHTISTAAALANWHAATLGTPPCGS